MNEPAECECCGYQMISVAVLDGSAWVQACSQEIPGCLGEAYYVLLTNPLPSTLGLSECLCVCVRDSVCTCVCGITKPGFGKDSVQQRAFSINFDIRSY